MSVRRLFSRGGQNFPGRGAGGGQKHTICLKSTKKVLFFSKKVKKTTILPGQGEKRAPELESAKT